MHSVRLWTYGATVGQAAWGRNPEHGGISIGPKHLEGSGTGTVVAAGWAEISTLWNFSVLPDVFLVTGKFVTDAWRSFFGFYRRG